MKIKVLGVEGHGDKVDVIHLDIPADVLQEKLNKDGFVIIKSVEEETNLAESVAKMIAIADRRFHAHEKMLQHHQDMINRIVAALKEMADVLDALK